MLRLFTLLSALFFATAASATSLWVDAPRDGYLNLRSGPSKEYHVLGQMPHGSKVKLIKAPGKWYKVRHNSGVVGWAHSRFLSEHKVSTGFIDKDNGHGPVLTPKKHHKPKADKHAGKQSFYVYAPGFGGLNLRDGPGTHYPVLLTMKQRAMVVELGRQGSWILVRHKSGQVGWAHGDYLVKQDPGHVPAPNYGHNTDKDWRFEGGQKPPRDHGWNGNGWNNNGWQNQPAPYDPARLANALQRCFDKPAHRLERCVINKLNKFGSRQYNW